MSISKDRDYKLGDTVNPKEVSGDICEFKGERRKPRLHIPPVQVYKKSISQKVARAVMRHNFWGVEEFQGYCNTILPPDDLKRVARAPWTKEILMSPCPFTKGKRVCDTHLLKIAKIYHKHAANPEEGDKFYFEWVLLLKNPPAELVHKLPPGYGIQQATNKEHAGKGRLVLFRRLPEK